MTKALTVLALILAGALGAAPLFPPRASPREDVARFSAKRAFEHIERIAREPHPIGTKANQDVREYLVAAIRRLGLEPETQPIPAPDYYGPGGTVSVVNVMTRIPGDRATPAIALVGHYDTVPTSPGANDDASAIAVMLESARALLGSPERLGHDVILLFTDGEEPAPRYGSTAFVQRHPWAEHVGFVINLEAVGSGGPPLVIDENGPEAWVIEQYAEAAPYPVGFSYLTSTAKLIGGSNTDFAPFRDSGVAGIELAYLHGSSIYHTLADSSDHVGLDTLQQHGENVLALARWLADLESGQVPDDSDVVFFTVGRFALVRYPAAWTLALVLAAGLILAVSMGRQRRWRSALRSAVATLLVVVGAGVLGVGAWMLIARPRDTMGVLEGYAYLGGLIALTAGLDLGVRRLLDGAGARPDAAGVALVWWVLGAALSAVAPGLGYLFVWPALLAGLVVLARTAGSHGDLLSSVGAVAAVGPALVLVIPAIDTFFQLAQPRPGNPDSQMLPVVALPLAFAALLIGLIRSLWPCPTPSAVGSRHAARRNPSGLGPSQGSR